MPSIGDTIRAAASVISGIDSIAERERLMDLVRKLEEAETEMRDLRRRNEALAAELARRKALERIGGAYWLIEGDGTKTGPVCPRCYEETGIVHLLERRKDGAYCPACKTSYAGVAPSFEGRSQKVW